MVGWSKRLVKMPYVLNQCCGYAHTSVHTSHTLHLTHLTHLTHQAHQAHLTYRASYRTLHTVHLIPYTSYRTPHTVHLIPYTSYCTPHTVPHLRLLFPCHQAPSSTSSPWMRVLVIFASPPPLDRHQARRNRPTTSSCLGRPDELVDQYWYCSAVQCSVV
jgi:hypothetical protein